MKNNILHIFSLILFLSGLTVSGVTRQELEEYFPVAKQLNQENAAPNMAELESLAGKNVFAAQTLYLIHSRGSFGQPVNYRKAAGYFDSLLVSSSLFWITEYRNVWEARRLPPTAKERTATISTWDGKQMMRSEFPLRGKYPLEKCYLEEIADIGGIGARIIFASWTGSERLDEGVSGELRDRAIELGCAAAKFSASGTGSGITPERFELLRSAADAGYVPAMIRAAEFLTNLQLGARGPQPDLQTAREYLEKAVKKCGSYASVGCKHAEEDGKKASKLLAEIPDPKLDTAQLLEIGSKGKSPVRSELLAYMIAARNDHPSCGYFRTMREPDFYKALAMKKEAAVNGSAEAVRELVSGSNHSADDYWFWLYLAGKLNLSPRNPGEKLGYYEQAFAALRSKGYTLPGDGYKKGLAQLGKVYPPAQQLYDTEFGKEEAKDERLTFKVGDPEILSAEWFELQGRPGVKVSVKPSSQQGYVDFTRKSLPGEKNGSLSIRGSVSGLSNYHVWADLVLPDGTKKRLLVNEYYNGPLPSRMRLNIAPGERAFELLVLGF